MTSRYNQHTLVAAIKNLLPRYPDLRLVLVRYNVDTEYLARVEDLVAREGVQANVTWLHSQETMADMARLYRMADIVVSIPSSEGYGFTAYEAMACGTPTLTSDLPVFAEKLVHGVHTLKVPARDVKQTGLALARLLTDDGLRPSLARNGLELTTSMSIEDRTDQVESLYQQILTGVKR
jgi:glycosyltransferase involved in cell wall biosynthesis